MIENFNQIGYLQALFVMASHRRKMNSILSASCLLPSIFFFLCSCRVDCYARDTLKQGEWITDDGTTLVSSGGTFELGFFTPIRSSSHNRYVGIWYKWDNQTVVWVANRDSPVLNGSTGVSFGIAGDGNLKILNTTGNVYWNTTGVVISSSTNPTVKLMDSGNLVILSDDDDELATSLWESFQHPTDTFLAGMKMDENLTLTSWIGDGDPGSGNFTFKQDLEGEGEGRYVISKKPMQLTYWRNSMSGSFLSSDEMPDSIASLLSNGSTNSPNVDPCGGANPVVYYNCVSELFSDYRLVMNYTGELQYYRNRSLKWWRPEDECGIYNACGYSGSCNINNRPFLCKCLPGFQPTFQKHWDSGNFLDGCTRSFTSTDESDMFLSLKMMKVSNYSAFIVKNETECRKECLSNILCQAYSMEVAQSSMKRGTERSNKCWIWTSYLSNLQEEYTYGGINLFVRVPKSVIEPSVRNCKPCGTNLIPYPLSTGLNCGDPMYFSFSCNSSTGQVSFNASSRTYRVVIIDPSTRKFAIQDKRAEYGQNSKESFLDLNQSLPFTVDSNSYEVKPEVEISWKTPQEPNCNSSRDCKDWPNSTCDTTRKRCLCTGNFVWDGANLNCTKGQDAILCASGRLRLFY